jgi:pentalenene oxygenase
VPEATAASPAVGRAPGWLPLLGHTLRIGRDPLGFLMSLPACGDLVQVKVGPWRSYLICNPDLVLRVLLDDRTFDKGGPFISKSREVIGNGVATCPHGEHRRQRRLVQPAFHRDRMPGYAAVMSDRIERVTGRWRDGQVIRPGSEMTAITTSTLTATLFATGLGDSAIAGLEHSVNVIFAGMFRQLLMPRGKPGQLLTPGSRRYARAHAFLKARVDQIIDDYRHRGASQPGTGQQDMLSMLLAARDEDGTGGLTDAEVYDQVLIFLIAGIDTTAAAMAWACLLLARHPGTQDLLHAEAHAVLGGRTARWEDLPGLELTGHVVTEALRLYPPAWILTRIVTRDTELDGHPLPAGTTLLYSPYLLQHRADLFPDPGRFDPGRWLTATGTQRLRGDFIPFSGGARQCIGKDFALTEATLALATIAGRWRLESLDHPARMRPAARRVVLSPTSARLRVHRRRNP